MKKILALLLMLMLLLAGCGERDEQVIECYGGPVLEIMKVSPEGISYVLNNYGAAPITFGAAQGLEVLRDGSWQDLEPLQGDIAVIAILYELAPGGVRDCGFYWQDIYGTLPPGQYRLVKSVTCGEKTQQLYAEFTIE